MLIDIYLSVHYYPISLEARESAKVCYVNIAQIAIGNDLRRLQCSGKYFHILLIHSRRIQSNTRQRCRSDLHTAGLTYELGLGVTSATVLSAYGYERI